MTASTFRTLITEKERLLIRFIGPLTEVADLDPVRVKKSKPVEIDLEELSTINSVGVREFQKWIRTLENETIEFSHCPKFFIDQVNMVEGFLPSRAQITSFYVPFFNSETGTEKTVLFREGIEYSCKPGESYLKIPDVKGDSGEPMEIDVLPSKFFHFLKIRT